MTTTPAQTSKGAAPPAAFRRHVDLGDGVVVSRSLAETDPARWQNDLQRAYVAKTIPTCLCTRHHVPMYIARLGDVHVLKRRPNTGHEHHPDCESHGGISQAAHLMYTADAISERPDGKVAHTLSVPLSTIEHARLDITLDEAAAPPRPEQHTKRTSMTLRGFLNLLWEESGLSAWSPRMAGKRRLSLVYWRLREALMDRLIGTIDAHQLLYIPEITKGPDADGRARKQIEDRLQALQGEVGTNHRPILLVLGELRSIHPSMHSAALRLKGFPDHMPIWTAQGSIERLRQQWPAAMDRFIRQQGRRWQGAPTDGDTENRIMILAGVQASANGNLQWRYGAAMETTDVWIPVDSEYEAVVARQLVDQQRRFHKPLRYDGEAAMFPDFVLMDMPQDVPMEVYGFSGETYERRKHQKIADYAALNKPFWHWDLKTSPEPPPFPVVGPRAPQ